MTSKVTNSADTSLGHGNRSSNKPVVQFDFQIFCRQSVGGVSRYFSSLASELAALKSFDVQIVAPLHVNDYLRELSGVSIYGHAIRKPPHSARLLTLANLFLLRFSRPESRPDVVHQTFYNKSRAVIPKCPVITTVHDLIHESRPNEFSRADNMEIHKRQAIMRADRVICVSDYTKRDLINRYEIAEDKVTTIYLGSSLPQLDAGDSFSPVENPYLLYVGRRSGYKNFDAALEALSRLRDAFRDFKLVCFGGGAPTRSELEKMSRLGIPMNRVIFTSGDDHHLVRFYRHATALIFPSLHEGFGLPVLEAMSFGCPVVCSSVTSIPEVGGDAVMYFDPRDVESIADAFRRTLYDSQMLADLKKGGIDRARLFSWKKCALETADVYRNVL